KDSAILCATSFMLFMPQIYKIYMNQSVLLITDFEHNVTAQHQSVDYEDIDLIKLFKETKDSTSNTQYVIKTTDTKRIFKKLTSKIKTIEAAGGIVKNGKGKYLFIYRLGKWDLPKGKVDRGEKTSDAAVREVEEECGINVDYRGPKLASTYHLYKLKGELVIKKTTWYEMGVNKAPKLTPQKSEDITKAVWLDTDDLHKVQANTYPLIEDLLALVRQRSHRSLSQPL